ncbi:hypothetical protein DMUE_4133, partial [Dictyocoela muelleri]
RPCKGKLKTEGLSIIKYDEFEHECIPLTQTEIKKIIGINKIKTMAEKTCLNNKQIISEAFKDYEASEIASFSNQRSLNRMIKNIRDKTLISFDDTDDIPDELKITISGHNFLQYDGGVNNASRFLLFINSEKISHLKNSEIWLADGTFKMAPAGFYQIYIIYAKIFDKYFPLIFAILPNKTEDIYSKLFKRIADLIDKRGPQYIIMDFEVAPMKAFNIVFKNTKIFNCFFHFSQNLWRQIQKNNLVLEYKNDKKFRLYIKMLLSIAFVKKNQLYEYFLRFKNSFIENFKGKSELNILNYFENNFINNHEDKINDWCCYERILKNIPLTTNICEGFNRSLNSNLKGSHPTLVKLIIILRTCDHLQDKAIDDTISFQSNNSKRSKSIKKLENIKKIVSKFEDYYDLMFLKAITMVYDFSI